MKTSKKDITLSEKDALQDMLDIEKLLMSYYNAALTEGSCKPFRKEILKNFTAHADTQFTVFEQMLARGYYEVEPAETKLLEETAGAYKKVLKEMKAC